MRLASIAIVAVLLDVASCSPARVCALAVDGHAELRKCSDGAVARVAERVCPATQTCATFSIDSCTSDADCSAAASDANGSVFCRSGECTCDECARDEDCAADSVCRCEGADFSSSKQGPGTRCFAGCRTRDDCARDELCLETPFGSFACQSADSWCRVDADCWFDNERCVPSTGSSSWHCGEIPLE